MAKSKNDTFKKFYPMLLEILPVDCLITQFYAAKLLSSAHKSKLDGLSTQKEKTKCFLDEVIQRGLNINYTKQFDVMLAFMATSDDPCVTFLAEEINESSRGITSPSRPSHGLNVDQVISQNAKTQGKVYFYNSVCDFMLVSVVSNC